MLHRDHGVEMRTGVGVEAVTSGPAGAPPALVRLTDGTELPADVVVVGIGVDPAVDWLEGSGLTLDNGVVCSETLHAAERVVAAGDVARWFHLSSDGLVRVEHWTHAAGVRGDRGAQPVGRARCDRRTTRCRSSGPTSTRPRSR